MHLVVVCLIGASKATNLYKEEIILVLQKRSECDPFYIFTQLKFNDSLSKERKLLLQEISMKTQKKRDWENGNAVLLFFFKSACVRARLLGWLLSVFFIIIIITYIPT